MEVNLNSIRKDFPLIASNPDVVYLDNANTSQKPKVVIDRLAEFYKNENANIHRGVYRLSEQATVHFEDTRTKVAKYLNAPTPAHIVMTRGTTEGINLIANCWGRSRLKAGDEIVLTIAEHHSNIVPWQLIAQATGAVVRYIPLREDYRLDLEAACKLITDKTKVVAVGHVSNVLGTIQPAAELIRLAKQVGAITVIDGAQGAPHFPVDVQKLGCDFYALSAHKMIGPTGIGAVYGRMELWEAMEPWQGGGDMIQSVTTEGSTWNTVPLKFEAGTPNIADGIAFGAAIDYLMSLPHEALLRHDVSLGQRAAEELQKRSGYQVYYSSPEDWVGVVTFSHSNFHPHDIAAIADSLGVCLRAGHHCAQPLMRWLKVPATSRISPYLYNNENDIDRFLAAMSQVEKMFG